MSPRRWILFVVALVTASCTLALEAVTQPDDKGEKRPPSLQCAVKLRDLATTIYIYAQDHKGHLPADLFAALTNGKPADQKALSVTARNQLISPSHTGFVSVPAEITPAWVNDASSYRYIGNADVTTDRIEDWSSMVIAHQRLEHGHEVAKSANNPEGEMYTVAFLDGHVELMPRAAAEERIEKSLQTLEALRNGTPAPPDRQAVQNLGLIVRAVHAYAKAHDGLLPPDLGSTFQYIPGEAPGLKTPQQRARVFLSPKSPEAAPDAPTPQWINEHAWYTYLWNGQSRLADVPEPQSILLVHGKLDDTFDHTELSGRRVTEVPAATIGGRASLVPKEYATWAAGESAKTRAWVESTDVDRADHPLPDWVHASRDLRLLGSAIITYTKAHDGLLPADLSEVVAQLTPAELARLGPSGACRVVLSPVDELAAEIPQVFTRDWVLANASYKYLGSAGINLRKLNESGNPVLIYAPSAQPMRIRIPFSETPIEVVPMYWSMGFVHLAPKEWFEKEIRESTKALQDASK